MKKKKLKLDDLKLKSFVTGNAEPIGTIKGGVALSAYNYCGTISPYTMDCPQSHYCTETCVTIGTNCYGGTDPYSNLSCEPGYWDMK